MSAVMDRFTRVVCLGAPLAVVLGLACSESTQAPPVAPNGFSIAYGLWTPGPTDTCTKEQHDAYAVVGPDGKLYPTWHPPIGPGGCTFGHEHGREPSGANLASEVGAIPFGYANEQLAIYDPANPRNEDHFGHKIEWENDVQLNFGSDAANQLFDIRCDVLVKMHQGTHSKDAFTNNVHEIAYHIRCSDGTELHVTKMVAIGTPGGFVNSCTDSAIAVGAATPLNSPDGGGERRIPDVTCARRLLVPAGQESNWDLLRESWQMSEAIRAEDGHGLAFFNPYFQAFLPSRFYDPSAPNGVGRPIDVCYWVGPNGERARGGPCELSTANGADTGVQFNDPRSSFNGAARVFDVNSTLISNRDGPMVWYTDPYGRHGRTQPFSGSVRQVIAKIDNDLNNIFPSGPGIGRSRPYTGQGVHAPN